MNNRPPVWQMIKEAVERLSVGKPLTNSEIKQYIHNKWKNVNDGTINAQIFVCCVNSPTRVYYPENQRPRKATHIYDFLYKVDRGRVELYDPSVHGLWEILYDQFGKLTVLQADKETQNEYENNDAIESIDDNQTFSFALESHLRDFLTRNLNSISLGGKKLSIFHDETDREGIEFQTEVGVIDILAQDENGDYYVVELKVGKGSDVVTGQIARYMGWVKKNLAAPSNANVKGIIISNEIDEKLKYATSWIPDITVFKYSINFEIHESVLD